MATFWQTGLFTWASKHRKQIPPLQARGQPTDCQYSLKFKSQGEREIMKRFAFILLLAGWLVPLASAQETEHIQAGIYADYFRLSQTHTNFGGVGARLGFIAYKSLKLEGEMSYDFTQAFTSGFETGSNGSVSIHRSNLRV